MRSEKWAEIHQAITTLEEETNGLLTYLSDLKDDKEQSFDVSADIPGTDGSTSDAAARILSISGVIGSIELDEKSDLVPSGHLQQMLKAVSTATSHIQALSSHLRSQFTDANSLLTFDYGNFHGQTSKGQSVNCHPQFKNLYDGVEALLAAFLGIAPVVSESSGDFQAAAKTFSQLLEKVTKDRDEVRKTLKDLKDIANQTERLRATTESASTEVNRLKDNSANDQQTISEYLAEATERREKIETVHASASQLESAVTEYDDTFQSFQRQLDTRDERFKDGTQKLDKLIAKFDEQEESFDALIKKSEDMLKSATVAGLAAHFGTIREELTTELNKARKSFYFGIGILVISALPLLALVLMPIFEIFYPGLAERSPEAADGLYYLGQVIARIIILLPAAWFVRFASRRHSSLFKLREDYAYKYSMAVSVDGFKKQAPDYESEIAAVVFEELAFNPADNMSDHSKKGDESPSKLMNMFQNMVTKGMDKMEK